LKLIAHPEVLADKLNQIPGVVEHGLFIGIATDAVIGSADGKTEVLNFRTGYSTTREIEAKN
jgi:ribose 5-phosphate isomerase A